MWFLTDQDRLKSNFYNSFTNSETTRRPDFWQRYNEKKKNRNRSVTGINVVVELFSQDQLFIHSQILPLYLYRVTGCEFLSTREEFIVFKH